ncbi:RICIN domain-containing protein [Saprospiraceae bacterium]|jgi:hypothetical protein|nr:RICIN domain-containing protein [Saprospiraceae bacterium]
MNNLRLISLLFLLIYTIDASAQTILSNGEYTIQQLSNDRFLDAHQKSDKDFSVVTRGDQDNDSQKWILTHKGGNEYTIQQKSTGRFLDAHGQSTKDYSVVTRGAQNNSSQIWILVYKGGNEYSLQQKSNKRFLDAHEKSEKDFSVVTRGAQNNNSQKWRVLQKATFRSPIGGEYVKIIAKHSELALDVTYSSTDDGAQIIQFSPTEGDNQVFKLEDKGNGYFQIIAKHSGKALSVNSASTENGASIVQSSPSNANNQLFQLKDKGDGYYQIIAKHSGKALDVPNSSTQSGEAIIQWPATNNDNQLFHLVKIGNDDTQTVDAEKIYFQIVAKHSGLALDVFEASTDNDVKITQFNSTEANNQLFYLEDKGDGYFQIIAKHSGLAMGVEGSSTENMAAIKQLTVTGDDNQLFKIEDKGDGYFQITAKHSGKALDVPGSSTQSGEAIIQWPATGNDNQLFKFVNVVKSTTTPDPQNDDTPIDDTPIDNSKFDDPPTTESYYQIIAKHSGKALNVNNSSISDGGTISQYSISGEDNQLFRLENIDEGQYMIVSRFSELVLDVPGALKDNGIQIHQWSPTVGDNQLFRFEKKGNGFFQIIAVHSGKALEVAQASTNNAAAITQNTSTGADNQLFKFVPAAAVDFEYEGYMYEDVPDMPEEDLVAVMKWIKARVLPLRTPYCYRDSYGRTAGNVDGHCPDSGWEKDKTGGSGGLCYPKCKSGYSGVGPVCWQSCPSGFRDDGAFCAKPASYGRGVGRVPDVTCPKGYKQRGVGAAAWCDNRATWPWNLKTKSATIKCKSTETKSGGLCYKKCRTGFHAVGCCICSPNCPPGFGTDIGVSCTKKSYGRGAGKLSDCRPGQERDGLLCYPKCKEGYHGVGPVCWQNCGPGWVNCGAGCAKSTAECVMTSIDQVVSVGVLAANMATLGLAKPASTPLQAGQKSYKVGSKVLIASTPTGKALAYSASLLQTIKPGIKSASQANTVLTGLPDAAKVGSKAAPKSRKLYTLKRIKAAKFGTITRASITITKIGKNTKETTSDFYRMFAEDFKAQTSPQINKKIDDNFDPETALYIKKAWGNIQLAEMNAANNWEIAQTTLTWVSIVDITGVTGVVSAYLKPICDEMVPWPTLSKSYK